MVHAEIISIEYNDYRAPGFTNVSYESRNIDKDLKYIIMFDLDDSDEERKYRLFKERLDKGETIRLVREVGASNTRITVVCYYLFTPSNTNDPGIKEWLDEIREKYDAIATDGDKELTDRIYNKRWPETEILGYPKGFEHAENIDDLDYGDEDDDE